MDILKPFADATEILSGDLYPTLGIVQQVFHRFLSETLSSKPGEKDVVKKIKDSGFLVNSYIYIYSFHLLHLLL